MTAGRKPAGIVPQEKPVIDGNLVLGDFETMVKGIIEAKENVQALARELAYEGMLSVDGLEEGIRIYQRRSVEALLEVGKRLLLLKESVGHGLFVEKLGQLGFAPRTAQRFMSAALRTSKSANLALLSNRIDGAGKFLELMTLDDDDIAELAETGSVRGITQDQFDCMSTSEMKKALREAEARIAAKDRVAADNQAAMQRMQEQLASRKPAPVQEPTPAFLADSALRDLDNEVLTVVARIEASLRSYLVKVAAPELEIGDILRRQAISGAMGRVLAAARQVAQDFGVAVSGLDAADGCGEDDAIWAATLADFDAGQEALPAPASGGDSDVTEG